MFLWNEDHTTESMYRSVLESFRELLQAEGDREEKYNHLITKFFSLCFSRSIKFQTEISGILEISLLTEG
jgi:ATP adenylyltransferase/5',5'''-P-1,P-4-tetraphosphate phosphorylase II